MRVTERPDMYEPFGRKVTAPKTKPRVTIAIWPYFNTADGLNSVPEAES
jgi:hypothetical protein